MNTRKKIKKFFIDVTILIVYFGIIFVPVLLIFRYPMKFFNLITCTREVGRPLVKERGLDGCDTLPVPGDKQKLSKALIADYARKISDTVFMNVDKLKSGDIKGRGKFKQPHPYIYLRNEIGSLIDSNKVLNAEAHLSIYNKDKSLALTFFKVKVADSHSNHEETTNTDSEYYFAMLALRDTLSGEFRLYPYTRWPYVISGKYYSIEETEGEIIYNKSSSSNPSDPEFFDKSEIFRKRDDDTYEFQWFE